MVGSELPRLCTAIPGPSSRSWVDRLARHECPAITARRTRRAARLGVADTDPIVWDQARGANVVDVDGNVFVDLTAGFGVALVGHGNPEVVQASSDQVRHLAHAMGDAFPDPRRIELLEALARRTGLERTILGCSGSDAVEAALKTARVATGRDRIVAFDGGYHGLSYGALAATAYRREAFRDPFLGQLGTHVQHAPFGGALPELSGVAAVLVEPIQGRGGIRVPPEGWLAELCGAAHRAGALVILDEIYTGFGRTGPWFAFQQEGIEPDLLCIGKGMSGGFPISACSGRAEVMDAWGASTGEALHTQTFLGNPVGSAMALASIAEVERLMPQAQETAVWLQANMRRRGLKFRGRGLLLGIELDDALEASRGLLQRGFIALPAGEHGEVLALTPPLCTTQAQLQAFLDTLEDVLSETGTP